MAQTIEQIIERLQADIDADMAAIERVIDNAKAEGRANLTLEEDDKAEEIKARLTRNMNARSRALAVKAEEDESEKRLDIRHRLSDDSGKPAYDKVMRIGDEPHTYSPATDPRISGNKFLSDVANAHLGDPGANERINRHMREWRVDNPRMQERAAGQAMSSDFPGIVVPQYLVQHYQELPGTARPVADAMQHAVLPAEGLVLYIPRGKTGAIADVQAVELTPVTGSQVDTEQVTVNVNTYESWEEVSLQALRRGAITERVVVSDMLAAVDAKLDNDILNVATIGLANVATGITWDEASPTAALLYPKFLQASAAIETLMLNRGRADLVFMAPRRWAWLQSELTNTWPAFAQPKTPAQTVGTVADTGYGAGARGTLPNGMVCVTDANIPVNLGTGTDEDEIFVYSRNAGVLFEDNTVLIRAEQYAPQDLGVMLVAYKFAGFTHELYDDVQQVISGTGLVDPYAA